MTDASQPVFVILNPYSGRGQGERMARRIRKAFEQAQVPFRLVITDGPGHAVELARLARLDGFPVVAAAGGDGTVNEVVNGLAQAVGPDDPVGTLLVLPVGSGNDFASMVGAAKDLEQAARSVHNGRLRQVDLGHATLTAQGETEPITRYFDNNMGLGFEAKVTVESRKITRLRGALIYLWAVFRALRRYDQPDAEIRWVDGEGQEHRMAQSVLLVTFGNSRRTGGAFYLTPDAVMDDGLLDIGVADALNTLQILKLLPLTFFGAHRNNPAFHLSRCREAHIRFGIPVPVHTDGEVVTETAVEAHVVVHPRRLQVLLPA